MADFGNLAADGLTHATDAEYMVRGNRGVWIHLSGDDGGGTFKIQFKGKDDVWKDYALATWTAVVDTVLDIPHKTLIRGDLSGATGPDLDWQFTSTDR